MSQALKLSVPDMTCGHCKAAVERAIATTDASAKVQVDLDSHTVAVETSAPTEAVLKALSGEGYEARVL
jgi:copper chaperone